MVSHMQAWTVEGCEVAIFYQRGIMGHKVFISYSTEDMQITKKICKALEDGGVSCWMAPRDILPGMHYSEAILDAISSAHILVLVFTSNANESGFVTRELERAASLDLHILPIRINNVNPSARIEFYISINQWFEAHENAIDNYLDIIVDRTKKLLDLVEKKSEGKKPKKRQGTSPVLSDEDHPLEWKRVTNDKATLLELKIVRKSKSMYYFRLVIDPSRKVIEEKTIRLSPDLGTVLGKAFFETTVTSPRECSKLYAKIGNLLYRRVLPTKIQDFIDNHEGGIVLETDDLTYPWDLLHDENSFLCSCKPFSRMSMSTQWVSTIFRGSTNSRTTIGKVLIIADTTDNQPESAEEAQELQTLFYKYGINTETLIGSSQCSYLHVKKRLTEELYAVIHIAGSLKYLPNRQTSALVLANDQLLTAEEICSLSPTPFVFLNVSHGSVDLEEKNRNGWQYAPINIRSMAQAFMYEGKGKKSVGVIGSMWGPMDTKMKRPFIREFYARLLSGVPLGDALSQAKNGNADEATGGSGFVFFGDMSCNLTIGNELKGEQPNRFENIRSRGIQHETLPTDSSCENTWSDDIKIAIYGAINAMQTMNWPMLSTVHLLLGFTYLPKGHLSAALSKEGFDPNQARRSLRKILEFKEMSIQKENLRLSHNLISMFKTAKQLSLDSDTREVEEKHLLCAILSQKNSGALSVLESLKIDIDTLKQAIGYQEETVTRISFTEIFREDGSLNKDLFDTSCYDSLKISGKIAMKMNWDSIRTPHLFLGILNRKGSGLQRCIGAMNLGYDLQQTFLQTFWQTPLATPRVLALNKNTISENLKAVIRQGHSLARFANREKICECDLLEAMLSDSRNIIHQSLRQLGIDISVLVGWKVD